MEGKINQANENCKHRMMHQPGYHQTQKYRASSSQVFVTRNNNKPQVNRPTYPNRGGGNSKPGGNYHKSGNHNNFNRAPPKYNNNNNANNNTAPRTGSNAIPVATKDKSQITCFECGVKGHYSNECPKKIAAAPNANANAPAQQQRRMQQGKKFTP